MLTITLVNNEKCLHFHWVGTWWHVPRFRSFVLYVLLTPQDFTGLFHLKLRWAYCSTIPNLQWLLWNFSYTFQDPSAYLSIFSICQPLSGHFFTNWNLRQCLNVINSKTITDKSPKSVPNYKSWFISLVRSTKENFSFCLQEFLTCTYSSIASDFNMWKKMV